MLKGLLLVAFFFYAAAAGLALAYLGSRDERLPRWMLALLGVGAFFHSGSLCSLVREFWAIPANRWFFPIASLHGVLSWLAFTNAMVFLVLEAVGRLGILGAFVLPWTILATGAALLMESHAAPLAQDLRSYWLNTHPLVLMVAYTGFMNAVGVGIALLVQERQIKSRKPSELCYRLPALEELDRLHLSTLAFSWPVLTLGMAMGAVWSKAAFGRLWSWSSKETLSLLVWLAYGGLLAAHRFLGVRGRRSVLWGMAAFALVLLTLFGSTHGAPPAPAAPLP
ncbi:MAG: cytochrome c biogenesis protein CcsA [Elusimicrobia bacterium]|nr:cytochrome c biogenesis protein CcsA [Elusimicrobiota bacterium]